MILLIDLYLLQSFLNAPTGAIKINTFQCTVFVSDIPCYLYINPRKDTIRGVRVCFSIPCVKTTGTKELEEIAERDAFISNYQRARRDC